MCMEEGLAWVAFRPYLEVKHGWFLCVFERWVPGRLLVVGVELRGGVKVSQGLHDG